MNQKNKHYISLPIWIISIILVGFTIGSFNRDGLDTWYITLNRSPLTPPGYVFSIVWSILYTMIGVSGWFIWRSKPFPKLFVIKILYIFQLILNWSWTPLFFGYQLKTIAFICLCMMILFTIIIIIKSYKKLSIVSVLLFPYLFWLLFAGYLNFYIIQYNQ